MSSGSKLDSSSTQSMPPMWARNAVLCVFQVSSVTPPHHQNRKKRKKKRVSVSPKEERVCESELISRGLVEEYTAVFSTAQQQKKERKPSGQKRKKKNRNKEKEERTHHKFLDGDWDTEWLQTWVERYWP